MRPIDTIVIHHAAAEWNAAQIDQEHRNRGYSGIGYHFVVLRDGTVEKGRALERVGAHAKGANSGSVGVCLSGRFDSPRPGPTSTQWGAALRLVADICTSFGLEVKDVKGHCEVGTTATVCPGFKMSDFRIDLAELLRP